MSVNSPSSSHLQSIFFPVSTHCFCCPPLGAYFPSFINRKAFSSSISAPYAQSFTSLCYDTVPNSTRNTPYMRNRILFSTNNCLCFSKCQFDSVTSVCPLSCCMLLSKSESSSKLTSSPLPVTVSLFSSPLSVLTLHTMNPH